MHSSTLLEHKPCAQSPKRQEKVVQFLQGAQTFQNTGCSSFIGTCTYRLDCVSTPQGFTTITCRRKTASFFNTVLTNADTAYLLGTAPVVQVQWRIHILQLRLFGDVIDSHHSLPLPHDGQIHARCRRQLLSHVCILARKSSLL